MSFACGFYDSINNDRLYFNDDLSSFLEGLITDGIFDKIDDKMMVSASATPDMHVLVGKGRAWFNGTWTKIDAAYQVAIPAADSVQNRIDAICLTVNKTRAVRDNYIEIISGTGTVDTPTKPNVQDETDIYRHVLAYVTVPKGSTAITQAQIENRVGIDINFITSKIGTLPTTEEMVAQWQTQFDEFMDYIHDTFDYDASTSLQTGINNFADEITPGGTYTDGAFVLEDNVLKKRINSMWVPRKVAEEIQDMKTTFQDGVDAVYNACVSLGITPSASTPEAIATALIALTNGDATANDIVSGKTAIAGKQIITGDIINNGGQIASINPGDVYSIDPGYHNGEGKITINPNQNSGTYTFPANDTGGTKDLGVNNTYRYVNAGNVYSKGVTQGKADVKTGISMSFTGTGDTAKITCGTKTKSKNATYKGTSFIVTFNYASGVTAIY